MFEIPTPRINILTTVNISLPNSLKEYIEAQVLKDGYSTTSEYVRELIREDKKRRDQEKLESMLIEGLDSGVTVQATPEFWSELWSHVDQKSDHKRIGAKDD